MAPTTSRCWCSRARAKAASPCSCPTTSGCGRADTRAGGVPPPRRPGAPRTLALARAEPGVWRKTIEANELGLWRATDGKLNALVNVGPANPREFAEVTSTVEVLGPLA